MVLGVAITAQTTASVTIQGVPALIPFFQQAFHSLASASLAMSAVMIGSILSMLFMGKAVDRYGERIVVAVTMVAMGAATIVAATIDPVYGVLLLILTLVGALYGAVQPGGTRHRPVVPRQAARFGHGLQASKSVARRCSVSCDAAASRDSFWWSAALGPRALSQSRAG